MLMLVPNCHRFVCRRRPERAAIGGPAGGGARGPGPAAAPRHHRPQRRAAQCGGRTCCDDGAPAGSAVHCAAVHKRAGGGQAGADVHSVQGQPGPLRFVEQGRPARHAGLERPHLQTSCRGSVLTSLMPVMSPLSTLVNLCDSPAILTHIAVAAYICKTAPLSVGSVGTLHMASSVQHLG